MVLALSVLPIFYGKSVSVQQWAAAGGRAEPSMFPPSRKKQMLGIPGSVGGMNGTEFFMQIEKKLLFLA